MKRTHIIGILLIAVAVAAILGSLSDSSTYADFEEAYANPDHEYHVVGKLNRSQPTFYKPEKNPDLFSFYMSDNKGVEKRVWLHSHPPQDFDKSEQIVVIGKVYENDFHATQILLKCPSKYEDGSPQNTTSSEK